MTPFMQAIRDYYIASTALVTGNVVLAADVNIWFGSILRGDVANIVLERRVNLQDGCIVHTDTGAPMTIEEGVVAGHSAVLHGTRIGRDTLIGMRATLLSGCEIGPECLIAAGTLVTEGKKVPPRSVVMGMPGKVVRTVTDQEVERTRWICAHYLELAQRYVRGGFPPPWTR